MAGITKITFEINGVQFKNFASFTENARVSSRQVFLMNSTTFAPMLVRHTFSLDRTRVTDDDFEFDGLKNATVTIEYEGGERVTFSGVHVIEVGSETADGENDLVSTIEFGAAARIKN